MCLWMQNGLTELLSEAICGFRRMQLLKNRLSIGGIKSLMSNFRIRFHEPKIFQTFRVRGVLECWVERNVLTLEIDLF